MLYSHLEANHASKDLEPWQQVDLLPGQHAVLHDPAPLRLFRGPQQALGKTWCGALDLIGHSTGLHPWCPEVVSPQAIHAWVVCGTKEQSIAVQQKLWDLLPKHRLHPETRWDDLRGFPGHYPGFRIRHVSGGWSRVAIKTSRMGGLALSSASLTYAWFDEPPINQRVFSEVHKRLLKAGRYARLLMTMTPINAPVEWLRLEVEEDKHLGISDHQHRLVPEELVPVTNSSRPIVLADGTECGPEWVKAQRAQTMLHEVPVVCDGEFRLGSVGAVFTSFGDANITTGGITGRRNVLLGVDYGLRVFAQCFLLVAVDWPEGKGRDPRVLVLDEEVGSGDTTDDDDAEAVIRLLSRHGIKWQSLKSAYGDNPHYRPGRYTLAKKSNQRLMRAIRRHPKKGQIGLRKASMVPEIRPAKRGACAQGGAVQHGARWLHRLMLQPGRFQVHARCEETIASLKAYDLMPNTDESHLVDALRYALRDIIYSGRALPGTPIAVPMGG